MRKLYSKSYTKKRGCPTHALRSLRSERPASGLSHGRSTCLHVAHGTVAHAAARAPRGHLRERLRSTPEGAASRGHVPSAVSSRSVRDRARERPNHGGLSGGGGRVRRARALSACAAPHDIPPRIRSRRGAAARAELRDGHAPRPPACPARPGPSAPRLMPVGDPNAKYAPRSAAANPSFSSSGGPGRSGGRGGCTQAGSAAGGHSRTLRARPDKKIRATIHAGAGGLCTGEAGGCRRERLTQTPAR